MSDSNVYVVTRWIPFEPGLYDVEMPANSVILGCTAAKERIKISAIIDHDQPCIDYRFRVIKSGERAPNDIAAYKHIGSVTEAGSVRLTHVFH